MKKIIPLLFVFAISALSSGQTYHPLIENGKTWNVLTITMADWFTSIYLLDGDTLLDGTIYQKLYGKNKYGSSREYLGCIREETSDQQLFFYDRYSTGENLLYDFSLETGDTVNIQSNMGWKGFPLTFLVDSVDQVIDETGVVRKRMLLTYNTNNFEEQWIEGIGSMQGLISPGNFFYMADLNWESLCTKLDGNVVYFNPLFDTCMLEYVGIEENNPAKPFLSIHPNPVESSTIITINNSHERVYKIGILNITGQSVIKTSFTGNHFNLGDCMLPSGFYMVSISNDNHVIAKGKFIVP